MSLNNWLLSKVFFLVNQSLEEIDFLVKICDFIHQYIWEFDSFVQSYFCLKMNLSLQLTVWTVLGTWHILLVIIKLGLIKKRILNRNPWSRSQGNRISLYWNLTLTIFYVLFSVISDTVWLIIVYFFNLVLFEVYLSG